MYVTAGSTVFALEPETGSPGLEVRSRRSGQPAWRRLLAGWATARQPRLYTAAGEGRMVALDAEPARVIADFGEQAASST